MRIPSTLLKPAALLLLGASTVFGCSIAKALTFSWSWTPDSFTPSTPTGNVTGTISGLLDNQNNQTNGVVTITSSPTTPVNGWGPWTYAGSSDFLGITGGFNVANGVVTAYDAYYQNGPQDLFFGTSTTGYVPTLSETTPDFRTIL